MNTQLITHVVDDDPAVREGLCALLGSVSIPARAYASADEFLRDAEPGMAGCLVVDVRMPGMSGLDLLQALHGRGIHIPVIVITGHGDVPMAVKAMKAGAVDFLLKPFNEQELLDLVVTSLNKHGEELSLQQGREQAGLRFSELTPRERQILQLIMDCQHSKAIAFQLGISERTVDVHRYNIMRKTRTRNLSELVKLRMMAGDDL